MQRKNTCYSNKVQFFYNTYSTEVNLANGMHFEDQRDERHFTDVKNMLMASRGLSPNDRVEIIKYLSTLQRENLQSNTKKGWSLILTDLLQKDKATFDNFMSEL